MYAAIVKPYIDSIQTSRIQWVYNILEKKVSFPYHSSSVFSSATRNLCSQCEVKWHKQGTPQARRMANGVQLLCKVQVIEKRHLLQRVILAAPACMAVCVEDRTGQWLRTRWAVGSE